jgi:hypothetical protein
MSNSPQLYEDWKDFFTKRLIDTGAFRLADTFSKGDADIEIYSALRGNPETFIKVGYFSPITLIYIEILNPSTPGKNRQQEIEHLYKYEFDNEKQYGPPGLDFNEINVHGIGNLLDQGFNGRQFIIEMVSHLSQDLRLVTILTVRKLQSLIIFKGSNFQATFG